MTTLTFGIAAFWMGVAVRLLRSWKRWPHPQDRVPGRFAVVSHAVPPMWSGQAMVLDRLMAVLPAEQCVFISSSREAEVASARNVTVMLPSEPFEKRWLKPGPTASLAMRFRCIVRAWRIITIVTRERCAGIVACTGELIDLPASAIACRALGITFVAYYFDDYVASGA